MKWMLLVWEALTEEHEDSSMVDNVVSLQTEADLYRVITVSKDRPVFIYKHSTACPICARTYRLYHEYAGSKGEDAAPIFSEVFVIEKRVVSDAIENRFGIQHQSPQLLLIADGQTVWNTSHFDITDDAMDKALEAIQQ